MSSDFLPARSVRRGHQDGRDRDRGRDRGVVLIFVVAILVLLAVIATTYLSMARIDRVTNEIRGGLSSGNGPPLPDFPVEEMLIDVFAFNNVDDVDATRQTGWLYRPAERLSLTPDPTPPTFQYKNYDYLDEAYKYGIGSTGNEGGSTNYFERQKHDPWLASRMPIACDPSQPLPPFVEGPGNYTNAFPIWPKISRWPERWNNGGQVGWVFDDHVANPAAPNAVSNPNHQGYFESPYANPGVALGTAPTPPKYTSVNYAIPTYIRIDYGSYKTPATFDQKTVVYPALQFPIGPDKDKIFLAADADADGVADSALFSLGDWKVGGEYLYPDVQIPANSYPADANSHFRRWYAAVRIVDATAAININTASRRNADIQVGSATLDAFDPSGLPNATLSSNWPNYGFFRSNIGLFELLPGLYLQGTEGQKQWDRFQGYRLNNRTPLGMTFTGRGDYVYTSLGEALEMNLARRPANPSNDATGSYTSFSTAISASLAFLNGEVNPRESRSALDTTLNHDAYWNVPNWGASNVDTEADKESRSFTFFAAPTNLTNQPVTTTATPLVSTAAGLPMFWWHSMYNPDDTSRGTYFMSLNAYTGSPALPPRPVRQFLTASNPQTTSARPTEVGPAQPAWLTYTITASSGVPMKAYSTEIRPKGSINTDAFDVLWRQFFLTMADPRQTTPLVQPAAPNDLLAPGRRPAGAIPDPTDTLYLRSAIAAVNAIDQRDGDDDITTYRILLPSGKFAMVAGAEQQLFFSSVKVDALPPGGPSGPGAPTANFTITLRNPYGRPLDTSGYSIAFMPAGGGDFTTPVPIATPSVGAMASLLLPPIGVPTGGAGDIVLLRTRRSNGLPTNTSVDPRNPIAEVPATGKDLVCVDIVPIGDYATEATIGTVYDRDPTPVTTDVSNQWKIATAGTGLHDTFAAAVSNPVALDNLPLIPAPALTPSQSRNATAAATDSPYVAQKRFPFGGYPRNGDMLTIPYVGHYALYSAATAGATLIDAVPITWDVQKVQALPVPPPQIAGRFTPVPAALTSEPGTPLTYAADWRSRILDNFTTLANPMKDYFPNMAQESWLQNAPVPHVNPFEVLKNDPQVLDENLAPVHGLININTADYDVLRMVPFITNPNGVIEGSAATSLATFALSATSTAAQNDAIAKAIIDYRRINGPFRSTMDILNILPPTGVVYPQTGAVSAQGQFFVGAPMSTTYADRYHSFVRVSNLLTTRSDAFVIYLIVQQWQDFGTDKPVLIEEHRKATLVDRSRLRGGHVDHDNDIILQSVGTD